MIDNGEVTTDFSDTAKLFIEKFQFIQDYQLDSVYEGFTLTRLAGSQLVDMMESFPEYFDSQMDKGSLYFSWGLDEISKVDRVLGSVLSARRAIVGWDEFWCCIPVP